jgi:hypothetical protein
VRLDGNEATSSKLGSISGEYIRQDLEDILSFASFAAQPDHRWAEESPNSHQRMKISVQSYYDGSHLDSKRKDGFIFSRLHAELGYMTALITDPAKQSGSINGNALVK